MEIPIPVSGKDAHMIGLPRLVFLLIAHCFSVISLPFCATLTKRQNLSLIHIYSSCRNPKTSGTVVFLIEIIRPVFHPPFVCPAGKKIGD